MRQASTPVSTPPLESDAILVLNPDVRLHAGCARALLDALETPHVGVAAPRLVDGDGNLLHSIRRDPTIGRLLADATIGATRAGRIGSLGEVVTDPARYDHDQRVDWAEGSTLLISFECWRRVGPWDESFFLYSEETEFALRVRDHGYFVAYVTGAHATHLKGGSADSARLWPLLTLNRWRLIRKRRGDVAATLFWMVLVLREGSRAALGRPQNRAALRVLLSSRRRHETPGPHSIA